MEGQSSRSTLLNLVCSLSPLCLQIPNGAWIIVPGILAVYFAREIAALLTAGAGITDSPFAFSEVKEAKKLKET